MNGLAKEQPSPDDRLRNDEALRRSEERYRALVEAASQAVWSWVPGGDAGDFTRAQQWWEELTGQSLEEQSGGHEGWLKVIHPDDREATANAWRESIATGKPYHVEYRVRGRAGDWRHVQARGIPILSPSGSVREWVGTLNEVTDQRRAETDHKRIEAALRESEERLRLALDAGGMGVWAWDIVTGQITWSDRVAEFYGMRPGEFDGTFAMFARHLYPEDAERAGDAIRACVERNAPYLIEYRIVRKDGDVRWIHSAGKVVRDDAGKPLRMIGATSDITDQKRAEEQFKQSEERLRRDAEAERQRLADVFQNAPSFMCVLRGADHVFERANNRYFELLGGRDIIGKPVRAAIPEIEGQGFFELLDRVYETGEPYIGSNIRVTLLRGGHLEERILEFIYQPLREPNGEVGGILVQGIDLTDRVRAEIERASLAKTLELALEAAELGTWDWNPQTDQIILSGRGAEIYGLPPGQTFTREWMRGLMRPDHRNLTREAAGRAVSEKAEYDMEYPLENSKWVSARGRGVYDADGRLTRMLGVVQDVTARKAAETDIRASEVRYRVLVNTTSDVVYRMSADWAVMQPLDGRGLVASNTEPKRDWMESNLPAFVHARVREAIGEAIRNKQMFEMEHQVNRADGTLGWTFSRAVPILDADGNIVEWFGTARDVTVQKQAEEELARVTAESERRKRLYDTALSNTPDFVYLFGLDGRFTYVNKSLLDLWGKELSEAVGKNFFDLDYPPELAERLQRQIRQVIDTRQPLRDETPYTSAAGTRAYEYIFVPIFGADGAVETVAGSTRDITERKQTEEALRASEGRFRTTADHAPVLIWIADTTKAHVWFNKPWLSFTGRTMAQEQGDGWAAGVHPEDQARCREIYTTNFDARKAFTLEYRLRRHDGQYRWMLGNGLPLNGADGEFMGYIGSCVDVHDQKETEAALRESDRKKDDFIALLAHELRNPLAPIRNGLQVIRLSEDRATLDRSQAMMDRQLSHMVRLIDDLLDVSRIGRNKMELRRTRISLADVVNSAVETARPAIDEAGHELAVSMPKDQVFLHADLTRLSQVLSNLLTNSTKYTGRGGRVWLSARQSESVVVVSVRDNGIGIPADSIPTIFDMFSQVDRSIERSTGGLGIGLALVKGLVEMHGGTVSAESGGQGHGSTFTVTLPTMAEQTAVADLSTGEISVSSGAKRRILVVDDNRDGAESLAMMLELIGNDIAMAHNGLEAVERAGHFRPEVILMDVGMPKLNGLEATKRIREHAWGRNMTIIALTGWGQEADRERSRKAGCDGHLVKPVDLSDLERLLGELEGAGNNRLWQ
ncbi:PAS domain S-box protein [Zavarzinella formosa]|uniref:PAS domain S-box protein n=1 Tax=Zavarzinella formosa TaxID=360055 RepID=UPI00138ACCC0|nr:PAS domain S-box protein [Zavarzinella formosa]